MAAVYVGRDDGAAVGWQADTVVDVAGPPMPSSDKVVCGDDDNNGGSDGDGCCACVEDQSKIYPYLDLYPFGDVHKSAILQKTKHQYPCLSMQEQKRY